MTIPYLNTQSSRSQGLRYALRSNGIFSLTSGTIMTVLAVTVANNWLGIDHVWPIRAIGIGLLFFAGSLFYDASRPQLNLAKAEFTIVQDVLWVIGSIIIVVFDPVDLSTDGQRLVGAVALVVAFFAIIQALALQHLKSTVH